jgi:hypothetical protein
MVSVIGVLKIPEKWPGSLLAGVPPKLVQLLLPPANYFTFKIKLLAMVKPLMGARQ